MGAVTTKTKRRLGHAAGAQHPVYAGCICDEDGAMAGLAWNRIHRRGRTLDHRMRRMATGTDRSRRVAIGDQRRVNARVPLLELVIVAGVADLHHCDGKLALAGDRISRWRMAAQAYVNVAAGTSEHAMDRLREVIRLYS